jgi:uncharacterized protein YqeY
MSIIEKIRKDSLEARKLRDSVRANLLVTLLSEAQTVGKNAKPPRESTDEETIQVIKKFIKNAEQTVRDALSGINTNRMSVIANAAEEVKILSSYLPQQMSEETIAEIIKDLKAVNFDMKSIMQYFKETHAGRYDGATVARLAK